MVAKIALTACLGLWLLGGASAQAGGGAGPADISASEILARMRDVYANCKSYRDAGVVQEVITHPAQAGSKVDQVATVAGLDRSAKPFRTAFVRPGKFRFEYTEARFSGLSRYIVWEDGADVRTWWDVAHGERKPGSLTSAIAGAAGVSSVSAHTVPRMLMPLQVSGTLVTDLLSPERLPDAPLDDAACYRVKGLFARSTATTLWIDHDSFLLRRMERDVDTKDLHISTVTTYEPELDVEIGRGELAFDPPAEVAKPKSRSYVKRTWNDEAQPRFQHARQLVDAGDYDAALTEFEWLWDATNNPESAFDPRIRLDVVQAIGRLAAVHPPTRSHFVAIFDGLDAKVRANDSGARNWTDWADLGRALKLDDRIVQLYLDRRSPTGSMRMFTDIHPYAFDDLLEILIERKQIAAAAALYEDPIREAKSYYTTVQTLAEASGPARWAEPADMLVSARDNSGFLYALTVAADRTAEADEIASFMLAQDDTVEARRALVLACRRMGVGTPALHVWIAEIRERGGDVSDFEAPRLEAEDGSSAAQR